MEINLQKAYKMTIQKIIIVLICLFLYLIYFTPEIVEMNQKDLLYKTKETSILEYPIQERANKSFQIEKEGKQYTLNLHNKYYGKAKVLDIEKYYIDEESLLSPLDFVLGWSDMSIQENVNKISISQRNRFYYWNVDNFFIPRKSIEEGSANTHIIPLNNEIYSKLLNINKFDNIEFVGYLVDVKRDDGWYWNSSKTRADTGSGACEILLIIDIKKL